MHLKKSSVAFDLGEDFGKAKTAVGRSGRPKKLRGGRPPEGRPPGHYGCVLCSSLW